MYKQARLEQYDNDGLRADKFLELAKRWHDFNELTAPMLHEFVDKIIVHEADKSSGKRVQDVEIILNYIGQFAIPYGAEADADIDAENEADQKRAMWREYKRNQRAKAKQTQATQPKSKQAPQKQKSTRNLKSAKAI